MAVLTIISGAASVVGGITEAIKIIYKFKKK